MLMCRWKPVGELMGRRLVGGIRTSPGTWWGSLQSQGKGTCQALLLALLNGLCMLWVLQIFPMAQQLSLPTKQRHPAAAVRMCCINKLQLLLEYHQQLMTDSDTLIAGNAGQTFYETYQYVCVID